MSATNSNPTTRQVGKLTLTVLSDRQAQLTRVFDAPRRLIWEAISKPEHLRHWWGPRRNTMVSCELDFRSGGSYRYVLRGPDGNDYAFHGEIREVLPPERVVQTFVFEGIAGAESLEALTLTEHDGKTTLSVISTVASLEALEGMLQSGMEEGAAETYDRLEEYLASLAAR
ncbi:MAG TPA: SRPBCC family protein [Chloroflexota bacterium]|nr:SRPBCC family protein [Chloroflexota bacterium]